MAGRYELKKRGEQQEETRRKIARAAMELHQEVGPAATTVSDIARRAGVGRVTVYRHFADESEILTACSGLYFEHHPPPDISAWAGVEDPVERLHTGLGTAYAFHRETEPMMSRILADIPDHDVVQPYYALWEAATDLLLEPFGANGKRKAEMRAAIAVALSFHTWRQLVREHGLSEKRAVQLASRLVVCG